MTEMEHQSPASMFLYQIIKPIVRILIRFGYSARNMADLIRWAYVRTFYETPEFWRGSEPTALQCSIKTGIARQEVTGLLKIESPAQTDREQRRNRAARVLFTWANDPALQRDGKPIDLPLESTDDRMSFRRLAARYGADVRYHRVLDDLLAAGCVECVDGGVRIIRTTYGLNGLDTDKLGLAGDMVRNLLQTTEFNLNPQNIDARRLQRFWWQRKIPVEKRQEANELIKTHFETWGPYLDKKLARLATQDEGGETVEIGYAIYAYENDSTEGK